MLYTLMYKSAQAAFVISQLDNKQFQVCKCSNAVHHFRHNRNVQVTNV